MGVLQYTNRRLPTAELKKVTIGRPASVVVMDVQPAPVVGSSSDVVPELHLASAHEVTRRAFESASKCTITASSPE